MATYTPNLNLGKPEATDPFGNFRQLFNDNMDILDNGGGGSSTLAGLSDVSLSSPTNGQLLGYNSTSQKWENVNGGGGSGGHTIIDQSGNNMPSRTGLQFIGASVTDDSANNKTVVTVTGGGGGVHYSTSEQVIGTWIDSKPLYEKTYHVDGFGSVSSYDFACEPDTKLVIGCEANMKLGSDGANQWITVPYTENSSYRASCHWQSSNNHVYLKSNWNLTEAYVTLKYTKTTD